MNTNTRPFRISPRAAYSIVALGAFVWIAIFLGNLRFGKITHYALLYAQSHPLVIETLGEPVRVGAIVDGGISNSGDSGQAILQSRLSGSEDDGPLYVVATRENDEWTYESIALQLRSNGVSFELLGDRPEIR